MKPSFSSCTVILASGFLMLALAGERVQGQTLRILGGNVTLSITTGLAGAEPLPVQNTASRLRYRRSFTVQKITVTSNCPGQNFSLTVVATNVTAGTASPQVTLSDGMPPIDFITNIPSGFFTNATATLNYTAWATFAQGNSTELGDDVHTVTYTISAQ
ncbi:MAG: hypothetical protein HRF44_02245 [Ignavibacterium sp.]|jgi:hypothetical protein